MQLRGTRWSRLALSTLTMLSALLCPRGGLKQQSESCRSTLKYSETASARPTTWQLEQEYVLRSYEDQAHSLAFPTWRAMARTTTSSSMLVHEACFLADESALEGQCGAASLRLSPAIRHKSELSMLQDSRLGRSPSRLRVTQVRRDQPGVSHRLASRLARDPGALTVRPCVMAAVQSQQAGCILQHRCSRRHTPPTSCERPAVSVGRVCVS